MKYGRLTFISLFTAFIAMSCAHVEQTASYAIIPAPQSVVEDVQAEGFKMTRSTEIAYPAGDSQLENNAKLLQEYIEGLTGMTLKITDKAKDKNVIVLANDYTAENPEAYELKIDKDIIVINGATPAGNFYGIQTLRKSIPRALKGDVLFPAVSITDQPRFAYRGAHFDVARHFFPVDSIKSFIDMIALHNINRFHWHLTDDQGWRVEIKSRPLLTELGSKRSGTVIGHNSGEYDNIPVEGYFTQEEIQDIIDYAAQRYITIIPEIDLPGHMLAALKGYPELGCTGGPYEVWQQWGVSEDVLCAGNDSTYIFIDDVLGEIADLFPSEYVHIGGDESPRVRWEECEVCQAKIKELGLKSDAKGSKEAKLQSHVMKHAQDFLSSKGKKVIGWDEILEGGADENAVIMSWRGEGGGIEAARLGHDVIMTPNTYLYFDYYQSRDTENEPDAIGGYIPLEKVYGYEPYPRSLTPEEAAHIIGVQANLWTEYIPTFSQAQYMELPRMAALAEVQWSDKPKDYAEFAQRVPQMLNQYDANGYNYSTHVYDIASDLQPDPEKRAVIVTLTTVDNAPIYYTLDGTEPTTASEQYTEPIEISQSATVKAIAFRDGKPGREFTTDVNFNKATTRNITLETTPHPSYFVGGASTLVDGLKGGDAFNKGGWIGFVGTDLVAVIDLGQPETISEALVRTCVDTGSWIFDARGMSVAVSENGNTWTTVASEKYPALTGRKSEIVTHKLNFSPIETQFVKVTVECDKTMPDWFGTKGVPFIFVDEIELN